MGTAWDDLTNSQTPKKPNRKHIGVTDSVQKMITNNPGASVKMVKFDHYSRRGHHKYNAILIIFYFSESLMERQREKER